MLLQTSKYRPALLSSPGLQPLDPQLDLVICHCRMKGGSMISMELIDNLCMYDN
jgi:hypothetical protein